MHGILIVFVFIFLWAIQASQQQMQNLQQQQYQMQMRAQQSGGMTAEQQSKLEAAHLLFHEPDSALLLASGVGRHWPDGRGIFCNTNQNLFVWLNEEDHLRIVSMQGSRAKPTWEGKQIKEVFGRFIRACDEVQKVLTKEGYDFMHTEHHGPERIWRNIHLHVSNSRG